MCAKNYCRVCCHIVLDIRIFYPFRVRRYRCLGRYLFHEFGWGAVYMEGMFRSGFLLVGSSVLRGIQYIRPQVARVFAIASCDVGGRQTVAFVGWTFVGCAAIAAATAQVFSPVGWIMYSVVW